MQQVLHIPPQFLAVFADAGGAQDESHALGDVETAHGGARFLTLLAVDLARDTSGPRVIRHQHQVTPCQADKGGQCDALVAALLLVHLHHHFLLFPQDGLDGDACAALRRLPLSKQRAGDILHWQKTVPAPPVVNKRRVQSRLNADDPTFINIGFALLPSRRLDIQIVEGLPVHQRHPHFFRMSCID